MGLLQNNNPLAQLFGNREVQVLIVRVSATPARIVERLQQLSGAK